MKAAIKIFTICLIVAPTLLFGQSGLNFSGYVKNQKGKGVEDAPVQLLELKEIAITNKKGLFNFNSVKPGTYTLVIQTVNYETFSEAIEIKKSGGNNGKTFKLTDKIRKLDEVLVEGEQYTFGIEKLNAVQDGGLYEAKKTEVINITKLVSNKAANNARQAYSKVPSLNIWESDNAGLQLDIGGRGLSPRRSSNFNVRQNGYDISADALGYPESYYSPALQAVDKIEIVRGAGALQYGTQFGGLVNFKLKEGNRNKPVEFNTQNTYGAFNFFSTFNSLGGQVGKLNYYTYYNYKRGDGWRDNTEFDSNEGFVGLEYAFTPKFKIKAEYTGLSYLSQQPGGLNIIQFEDNPRFSNRDRGFFRVKWNLLALLAEYEISSNLTLYSRTFALDAERISLGLLETANEIDVGDTNRDLIDGSFLNIGNETRGVFKYKGLSEKDNELLLGTRIYRGNTNFLQAIGTNGSDADFTAVDTLINNRTISDFDFPNLNIAVFGETIFRLPGNISIVPGFRFEHIDTRADGTFNNPTRINSFGDVVSSIEESDLRNRRQVFLWGLGVSKKFNAGFELYANATANYRAINFTDFQIQANAQLVDPNIIDERGQSFDIGIRQLREAGTPFHFEVNAFLIRYNDRIGEVSVLLGPDRQIVDDFNGEGPSPVNGRFRTNIGDAIIGGLELFGEVDLVDVFGFNSNHKASVYYNGSLSIGRYRNINEQVTNAVSTGNRVEDLPTHNIKAGFSYGFKKFSSSLQATYVSNQFSDAANEDPAGESLASRDAQRETLTGVVGIIPSYFVLDLSANYKWNDHFKIHTSVNNLLDRAYFTRRATGYPGPGIIPALGRTWNITLDITF